MKTYTVVDFFHIFLIPDLKKMIENQLHYYAFAVICQGIELMGAALDHEPLDKPGLSEQRFTNSLAKFFKDDRYRNNQNKFFKVLRGALIHQLRPGDGFYLASEAKDGIDRNRNLENHESGATLLIIEPLFDDFCNAFERFRNFLEQKKPAAMDRFQDTFIAVSTLSIEYGKTTWNPELNQTVTLSPFVTGVAFPETHSYTHGCD